MKIIEDMGVDRAAMSNALGVDLEAPVNPKARFDHNQFQDLLNYAGAQLDDPHIGVRAGATFRISTYAGPSSILAVCKDIEEAADVNRRYGRLVHTLGFPLLSKTDEQGKPRAVFHWHPNYPQDVEADYWQLTELVMANYVMSLDWLAWGFGKGVKKVNFRHTRRVPLAEYKKIFNCDVEFDAPAHTIILNDDILNRPLPTANRTELKLMQAKMETILASYNSESSLVYRVEKQIRDSMAVRKPSLKMISYEMGLTDRSLRRKLKEHDASFKDILETVKKDLCETYLDQGRPLSEVAHLLWYSEQSAFARAYKNWHGVSPKHHK